MESQLYRRDLSPRGLLTVSHLTRQKAGEVNPLNNQNGMALLESIPLLVIFALLISHTWGFFSAIHTGILFSISSRTYAFETFSNRSDLMYFRALDRELSDEPTGQGSRYDRSLVRTHGIKSIRETSDRWVPEKISYLGLSALRTANTSNRGVAEKFFSEQTFGEAYSKSNIDSEPEGPFTVNNIWIRVAYGMCINYEGCRP